MSVKKFEERVFDSTNSENPWLMEQSVDEAYIDPIDNQSKLTAEYIWNKQGEEREALVQRIFQMLRKRTFADVIPKLSEEELQNNYKKLSESNPSKSISPRINDGFANSNSVCTNVLKHFSGELFYAAYGDNEKHKNSCKMIFENDELLIRVLKNRMGYRTTKEDGTERPYVFSMHDKMLFQGMRSSGLAYAVSTFKPMLAKYIVNMCYNSLLKTGTVYGNVFDYSSGWGARALGVGSINKRELGGNLTYYGVDPLTYMNINNMMSYYKIRGEVFKGGSEDASVYQNIVNKELKNKFDLCFSSPPYFKLESYSSDDSQSIVQYPDYENWLNQYWNNTVKNCIEYVLSPTNSIFALVILDKYKKYKLAEDMTKICTDNGLTLDKVHELRVAKNHLSGKKLSGSLTKNTEKLYIFRR